MCQVLQLQVTIFDQHIKLLHRAVPFTRPTNNPLLISHDLVEICHSANNHSCSSYAMYWFSIHFNSVHILPLSYHALSAVVTPLLSWCDNSKKSLQCIVKVWSDCFGIRYLLVKQFKCKPYNCSNSELPTWCSMASKAITVWSTI